MTFPAPQFANPATGASYRLILTGNVWRITKSIAANDDASVRLAHLRGTRGAGVVERSTLAAVVRGESARCGVADPLATFAAVVLLDLERTADMLTALAREAQDAYDGAVPGFRPQSPVLRQRRDQAFETVVRECQAMAMAWQASGLVTNQALSEWMTAALADR